MCPHGLVGIRPLVQVALALTLPVQVSSVVVSTQQKAWERTSGFPIVFDALPTNVQPNYFPAAPELSSNIIHFTAERVLRYESTEHAGLGDRLSVMAGLLSVASAWNLTLAFPPPVESLGRVHGNTTAIWWDEYVVTEPKIMPLRKAPCTLLAVEYNITSKADFDKLLRGAHPALTDVQEPVCIHLQMRFFDIWRVPEFQDVAVQGAPMVSVWTSKKVALLSAQLKAEMPEHYNAMHVRLGDKATSVCESALHVSEAAYNLTEKYPAYADEPWFLMSDGDEEFFADMRNTMLDRGFSLIDERELESAEEIEDNYMLFSALECAFAASDLALITFKDIGHRCMPEEQHAVTPKFIDCRSDAERAAATARRAAAREARRA